MLQIPAALLRPTGKPQKVNSKRLERVERWWDDAGSDAQLRGACLRSRISMIAVAACAKTSCEGDCPTLVKLGRMHVQLRTREMLLQILPDLTLDERLDVGNEAVSLLLTQMHVEARFAAFLAFPCSLFKLTARSDWVNSLMLSPFTWHSCGGLPCFQVRGWANAAGDASIPDAPPMWAPPAPTLEVAIPTSGQVAINIYFARQRQVERGWVRELCRGIPWYTIFGA